MALSFFNIKIFSSSEKKENRSFLIISTKLSPHNVPGTFLQSLKYSILFNIYDKNDFFI